jgi:hypothetical protein
LKSVWVHVMVAVALVIVGGDVVGAADYETPTNRTAKQVLPAKNVSGPNFAVVDPVRADGYMYHFKVKSTYGLFQTSGVGALRKLEHEIWAIGQLQNVTGSDAFLKSLKDQAGKPITFAKDVVTNPGETLSGIPAGVGRLFNNVTTAITTKKDASQDSAAEELLLIGSFKRDYATRYDVDPYSSNQVLQYELEKIGRAAALGSWTASAAMIPISGPASSVITGTSLGKSFNNVLKAEPPPRIRIINEEKFRQMGISDDLAKRYLDHPVYTPRQDLILVDSLARLGTATGRDAYVLAAMAATNETEANFFVNMAQILRGYHEKQGPITAITMFGPLTVAQTKAGPAIIPFALDHGVWSANADKISQALKARYKLPGPSGGFELWVTGTLSPRAKKELVARGFTVAEQVGPRLDIVD